MRATTQSESNISPALIAGTSGKFLGKSPLPNVVLKRRIVAIFGPMGSGKTSVAHRLVGKGAVCLENGQLQAGLLGRVRTGQWTRKLVGHNGLILDDIVWLKQRPGIVGLLLELLEHRAALGLRTVVCQGGSDGSLEEIISKVSAGSMAIIALRFPKGKRGKLRYGRLKCDELGIPRRAARGTDLIDGWKYSAVERVLRSWHESQQVEEQVQGGMAS
jgi:hypothetical protein